jgi:zinc protease
MRNIFQKTLLMGFSLSLMLAVQAEIYLDQEVDPLPMVELSVSIPAGFEARSLDDSGAAHVLADILEGGTSKLTRQEFQDRVAKFGASVDFSVSNQYSDYSLSFPVVNGKNYDGLIELLKDNWQSPRFDQQNFEVARTKLGSTIQSVLDSDFSLAGSTLRRHINRAEFGGFPLYLDRLDKITLDKSKEVYERDFKNAPSVWAGVVAPASSTELVKKILSQVFSAQGAIVEGHYLRKLSTVSAKTKFPSSSRKVLIIDKDQRTQMVTSLIAVSSDPLSKSNELAFMFGNHVLFDSGLASVFSDEIRSKRGLAYSVGSSLKQIYERPVLSVAMNPVREKQEEAMKTLSELLDTSFETGKLFDELSDDVYARQLRSFKNSKILSQSTPASRLAERSAVVTGAITKSFYESDPQKWNPSKRDVKKALLRVWKSSAIVVSFVGEAKELRPLVEKYFPNYAIKVIPYRETILSQTY